MAPVMAQQGSHLGFGQPEAVEASHIEMADAMIDGCGQESLAIGGIWQPQQAGAAEAEGRGALPIGER